ncbi:uncharacterized protein HD556DRAFT_1440769 [Suillus plorans]|uniref:Uncharacterized protein n=1 Tax=Suillus plorans TaxID=116603 RepID=A0A9P7DLJ5_9AGAM|nr:uncharacterized protein HD556DRAFT_1440769 [Suillus plorans]KAG1797808.1 hypothetical protein HD556DRAFT_1440769 [Suillus plorans]
MDRRSRGPDEAWERRRMLVRNAGYDRGISSDDDDDDDEEQEEEEEEEMSYRQFGWGEVGGQHTEHPGNDFSEEELPSQPQVTRHITPEIEFQYSHDEDDAVAQASVSHPVNSFTSSSQQSNSSQPRAQSVQIMTSQPDDILKCHHKKNGQPRLADPETLKLLDPIESDDEQPTRQSKAKRSKKLDRPKPTQPAWYGPQWKCFLEDAKGECRVQHALENPFPALVSDLPSSVCEVLVSVLVAWDQDGKQFEAGIPTFWIR